MTFLNLKYLLLIVVVLSFISCGFIQPGIGYTIKNNGDESISNIKLYTSEKLEIVTVDDLSSKGQKIGFLSMKKNGSDGDYIIEFTRENGVVVKTNGGYYTNGRSLDQEVLIRIENDTVFMKFTGMKLY
ncbi:MAG: hypothetical protein COB98_01705 [Flavobacteriaceae bacterium]|nr:MAG: hypothetical protein COB98_01705 [Flavobacteriaceae bacterium]